MTIEEAAKKLDITLIHNPRGDMPVEDWYHLFREFERYGFSYIEVMDWVDSVKKTL